MISDKKLEKNIANELKVLLLTHIIKVGYSPNRPLETTAIKMKINFYQSVIIQSRVEEDEINLLPKTFLDCKVLRTLGVQMNQIKR